MYVKNISPLKASENLIENVGKFLPRSSGQCISQSEHLFLQSPVIEDRTITFTVMCSKTVRYTKETKIYE